MNKIKNQSKIKFNTVWNLKPLFNSDNDLRMRKERQIILRKSYAFINKWKKRSDYLKNPETLLKALKEYENWKKSYASGGREGYYFWLRTKQDENNPLLKAKYEKIKNFYIKIDNDIQFFILNIAKIPAKFQKKFLNYSKLSNYKHFLERLFTQGKYFLSDLEEKILNLTEPTSYSNWEKLTSGFLAKEQAKVTSENGKFENKTFSQLLGLINNKNKKVRDSAAQALNQILAKYTDLAEAEINSILAHKKTIDELRGFTRPDSSRHIKDDIETKIVDLLVKVVSENFVISRRYYRLKAKLLGVKKLKYHERNLECGKIDKKYTYSESINLVLRVFKNLDFKFYKILDQFIKNGQIDVFSRKGKRSGAFCVHFLVGQPTYVFLNHTDKLHDVLTIAHEMGHAINNELMREKQGAVYFDTLTSTAEVASTFMEDFVLNEVIQRVDDEQKLSILMSKLNSDISSIFRQVAFYKFEQELHKTFREEGYLSYKEIGNIFKKHMLDYMGNYVEQSPGSENWWVYVGHFRLFFYVYSYASGLLISKSLQNLVRQDRHFIEKIKEFLSIGTSDSPKNVFKRLGVDITDRKLWDKGIKEVEDLLQKTTKLARKLGKI